MYMWKAPNELTMFINLRSNEAELFDKLIDNKVLGTPFNSHFMNILLDFATRNGVELDVNLLRALKYILETCKRDKNVSCTNVRLAGPYAMDPYIVYPNITGRTDNVPFDPDNWIRIGDSIFQGDFTIGTGLGYHFEIIGKTITKLRLFAENNLRWAKVLINCWQ